MIKQLTRSHLSALLNLLKQVNLPIEDINLDNQHFIGFFKGNHIAGTAALEKYGSNALLRSVAVSPEYQGKSLGKQLVTALENWAQNNQIRSLFLITESAQRFFTQLGYSTIARNTIPEEIKNSRQFSHICPATAICMYLDLTKKTK